MKELDEIDQLFQTTFEAFELTPDPAVKENIDRAIASKKKRRKLLFILFPVLLSVGTLAAFACFLAFSNEKQSQKNDLAGNSFSEQHVEKGVSENGRNSAILRPDSLNSSKKLTSANSNSHFKKGIPEGRHENMILRSDLVNSEKKITAATSDPHTQKAISESGRKNVLLRPDQEANPPVSPGTNNEIPQTTNDQTSQDQLASGKITDSATIAADSVNSQELAATSRSVSEAADPAVKKANKWSLSVLAGWESEKKRPSEFFDTTNFSGPREFAQIHGTSFYGKVELNRKINSRLDLIMGLGFRSTRIKQYGSLFSLDSFYEHEGISSVPPTDSVVYYIRNQAGTQVFQVNSIIMPLGLAYSIPITQKFGFRFSGGTEIAYSWSIDKEIQPPFSRPEFRPFGLNLWLRPEIHYAFGRCRLFGFGSFNQALYSHLKWDFTVRRNPAFGAGIGLLIEL